MAANLLLYWAAMCTSQAPPGFPPQPPAATTTPAKSDPASSGSRRGHGCCARWPACPHRGSAAFCARRAWGAFASPYFGGFPAYGFSEAYFDVWAFGPPGFVVGGPVGFGWFPPVIVERPILLPPPIVVVPPADADEARVPPPAVVPAAPRGATTDIPRELVEQLVPRARPTLAQRAQSARLEGSADRLFRAGNFDRAAERYQLALAQTPDNDDLNFKRGAALVAVGQYDAAGRVLRDALAQRPDWPFVAHDLRQLFRDEDSLRRAVEALRREARKPAADPDVQFLEAYLLYFSGQRDAAEPLFRNPPEGGPVRHFQVFVDALDRQRAK